MEAILITQVVRQKKYQVDKETVVELLGQMEMVKAVITCQPMMEKDGGWAVVLKDVLFHFHVAARRLVAADQGLGTP
ncbi:hypothetical protein [Comamonas aquatica]|uniref:hypothetical protein n=1 Tax=Comamonas aquatica TaxID=225991 RepID=UPI001F35338A|nr:hypothetical protein [Comamonas aquatica]